MNDNTGIKVEGFLKVYDPLTQEVFVDKQNAIHYENFSEALAFCIANKNKQFIYEMHFGNGGTNVDPTGVINYLPTNTNTPNANLYNPTYYKIVDDSSTLNHGSLRNKLEVRHVPGQIFTDILVTCLLDYGEPADQAAFDNSQNLDSEYVFDELGLRGWSDAGPGLGNLLTHVVFHPVQKSLNRQIQIDYTVRIQSLTNLSSQG